MTPEQKENLRKWVEALRSGEYKQGVGALRRTTHEGREYCCLGVACDVMDPGGWDEAWSGSYGGGFTAEPPLYSMRDWFGIESKNPMVIAHEHAYGGESLIDLNDRKRWPFPQIADAIERTFLR